MGTNVSNNVNTTERTYKPQASQSGQKTSAQNSIYDAKQPQTPDNGSTENKNISTEIDKILEKSSKIDLTNDLQSEYNRTRKSQPHRCFLYKFVLLGG